MSGAAARTGMERRRKYKNIIKIECRESYNKRQKKHSERILSTFYYISRDLWELRDLPYIESNNIYKKMECNKKRMHR